MIGDILREKAGKKTEKCRLSKYLVSKSLVVFMCNIHIHASFPTELLISQNCRHFPISDCASDAQKTHNYRNITVPPLSDSALCLGSEMIDLLLDQLLMLRLQVSSLLLLLNLFLLQIFAALWSWLFLWTIIFLIFLFHPPIISLFLTKLRFEMLGPVIKTNQLIVSPTQSSAL